MGVADANYKFIMIDVGAYGKDNDADVLENLNILKRLEYKTLKLPYPKKTTKFLRNWSIYPHC